MKKFVKLLAEAVELHGNAHPEYAYMMKKIRGNK